RHRPSAPLDIHNQLGLGCRARSAYGGGDPTARGRDLLVRLAEQAAVELRLAKARERKMRVRVDEAGDRRRAARVEVVVDDEIRRLVPLGTNVREAAVIDDDDRLLVDAQLPAAHRGGRGDLRQIADEERHYSLRARNIDVIGISLASCSASSMRSCWMVSMVICSLLRAVFRSIFRS